MPAGHFSKQVEKYSVLEIIGGANDLSRKREMTGEPVFKTSSPGS